MEKSTNQLRSYMNLVLQSKTKTKHLKPILECYVKSPEPFIEKLKKILFELFDRSLLNDNIKKTFKFISKVLENLFLTEVPQSQTKVLVNQTIIYLLDMCYASREKIRICAVLFLQILQNSALELSGQTLKQYTKVLEDIRYDKSKKVRSGAIEIANNLKAYKIILEVMDIDPNPSVRKKCMKLLPADLIVDKCFQNRLKDTNPELRLLAISRYQSLTIKSIPNPALLVIIFLCINDVNENVKKSAYELIAKSIDLFGYVYFFERIGIDNNNLIEIMKLKIQSDEIENMKIHDWFLDQVRSGGLLEIIILRLSCESMRKNNKELKITLEEVTELIQNHKSDNILLYNLLMISKCFDFFVPETRTCLLNVLGPICKEIKVRDYKDTLNLDMSKDSSIQGEDIIEGIVLIIREMFRFQENEYSRILKQMIDEVLEPGNSSYQKSRIQYEKTLNTHISLKQEHSVLKYESIKVNDGEETSNTLIKIEELEKMIYKYEGKLQKKSKKMYYRYYRALVICCYALKNAKILELNEEFCGLIDDLILPSYSYSHTNIKLLSLECLGYYCLLSSQAVRIYFSRFISELENRSELEICALKFMFDFYITNNLLDNTEFIKGIVVLSRYLNTQNTFILHFVIVGFCKIVLLDKLPKSVGILTKLIILYFTESKYCMDIIYKFLEILASTDQKKCFTVLKALKIYLSLKKNEKKLAFPVETSGKRIKSLVSMLETIYTNYTSKNLQFSLVFFFTKLFIGEYITQKSYEECVLDYNWSSFTSEDLVIIKDIIDSRKLKPKSMPKIISRAIKDKEILIDFPLSYYTYEKEHSKVLRLSSRFYNALSNYSEIGIFMCDRFEDVVLDGLPTKRSRQQSKSHEFISLD